MISAPIAKGTGAFAQHPLTTGHQPSASYNSLLAALLESTDDAIVSNTLQGIVTVWNKGAERLFGYTAEEMIGNNIRTILPTDRQGEEDEILTQLKHGEPIKHYDTVCRCKNGRLVQVSSSVSPIQSSDGTVMGGVKVVRNVTKRKTAEGTFRIAVEASPSAMAMVDQNGLIVLVNAALEKLFGYSREELIGQSIDRLIPERYRAAHATYRNAYLAQPESRMMGVGRNLYGLHKNGTEFPVEVNLNPVHSPRGFVVLCGIVDLTHRKKIEAAAARHTQELQRSNSALQEFAGVASHDLQEPLRMIVRYTELLKEYIGPKLDHKAEKYIGYIVGGGKRMQELIADLLAYSRINIQDKPFVSTDLNLTLKQVLEGLQALLEESGAVITRDPLPTLFGDPVQLRQLFQNLISNAIKFRSDRTPRIRIAARQEGHQWRVSVEDNGIGIEKQYSDSIFQMFQRLHERSKYEGNGIGLALAKQIVQRHGGQIGFESELNVGSTFFFTLPAQGAGNG
ncbi:MAG TPA: PAS domain S-box protein [Pirellulales bacterium]|nr:PAS domain S-box protein [Pirellulales bacterium]